MFKDKQSLPSREQKQPEPDTSDKKEPTGPRMSGTFSGFKPQWKHGGIFGESINKRTLKMEGGDEWTDVPFVIHPGGMEIALPDGTRVPVGIPFPRFQSGVLATIYLCGHAQAMALAWSFAAHVESAGGEIEVRAEEYRLTYDIKADLYEGKKAA